MNIPLFLAGLLSALAALIHPVAGEYLLVRHLQSSQLVTTPFGDGDISRRILRVVWHVATLDFFLSAVVLFIMALTDLIPQSQYIARFIALHFLGYTLLIWGVAGRRFFYVLLHVPQWLLLLSIGVLAWWGAQ